MKNRLTAERESTRNPDDGILVAPGTYTVHLSKRVAGKWTDLGKSQSFKVVPLRDGGTLPGMTPEQLAKYSREYDSLQRSVGGARKVLDDTTERLMAIRQILDRSTVGDPGFGDQVRAMERQVAAMKERLSGNEKRSKANDGGPVSISGRFRVAGGGLRSLYGLTKTQREAFSIAKRQFTELKRELELLADKELPKLDEAGFPWSPGRGVPGY